MLVGRHWHVFLICLLAPLSRADSLDTGILIPVFDELHLARSNELVKVLIPASESAAITNTSQLRLSNSSGVEVPVQWRVMARWKGGPAASGKAIRFALAQFLVDLAPSEQKVFRVERRKPSQGSPAVAPNPIRFEWNGSFASLITGPLRLDFSPTVASLFQGVYIDADHDGIFEEISNERVCAAWASLGSALIDRFGGAYLGALDAQLKYTVEEWGPLHTVIRVDGRHQPAAGPTINRDFLKFTTRYHLVAGAAQVRVEHSLKNSYLDAPLGDIGFARYLLHAKLDADGAVKVLFGGDPDTLGTPDGNDKGSVHAFPQLGEEVVLYQDSAGGSNWSESGTSFSGWRVWKAAGPAVQTEVAPAAGWSSYGQRSEGFMDVRDTRKGILIALRYPWENYPYALRAAGDGNLLMDLFPAEFQGLHWLDDAQRKTFELDFDFHAVSPGYDARLQARRMTNPLRPAAPLAYWRETKAWGDVGDLRDPHLTFAQLQLEGTKSLEYDYAVADSEQAFGAFDFGEPIWAKNTHTTGSPRNRLTYFDRFVTSGARAWFVKHELFALHSMDIRPYHIDGFKAADHPNCNLSEGLPAWPGTDNLGRNNIDPALAPHKIGIPANGHGWNGFDAEHMVVDDLYEYYLLSGSYNAYDAMQSIGQAMLTWKIFAPNKEIGSSRVIGWCLRALVKIWLVTGDQAYLDRARTIVESTEAYRGKLPSPQTGLVYHYLSRASYAKELHNMTQDYDLPWQMAVGLYGLACYRHATGDTLGDAAVAEVAKYIQQYCVHQGVVIDAIACDNHNEINPKDDNQGVNTWVPSALALAYRISGDPTVKALAELIFDQNDTDFYGAKEYYHWYHSAGEVLGK